MIPDGELRVVIHGPRCSGKSMLANLLAELLVRCGHAAAVNPKTENAKSIRVLADRHELVSRSDLLPLRVLIETQNSDGQPSAQEVQCTHDTSGPGAWVKAP